MTWHCCNISEDLHRFARNLQNMNTKFLLSLFLNNFRLATLKNNNKNNLRSYTANFFQICVSLQKYWNNAMSNDGLSIEMIDRLMEIKLYVDRINSWKLICARIRRNYQNPLYTCLHDNIALICRLVCNVYAFSCLFMPIYAYSRSVDLVYHITAVKKYR